MIKVREIKARSIITTSLLPDADFVINPYVGCIHSCFYCYARFMKRFTNHSEPWGKFIDVKINAPELIPTDSNKYIGKSILLSSVTDPYLPLERKLKLTRRILEKLISLKPALGILTKSDLVLRDMDLLKRFKDCEVGLTITTLDDNLRREAEPVAPSIPKRISALKKLEEEGIKTYVFIGPILPYLTDWKQIILATKEYTNSFMFENLNVSGIIWGLVKKWLKEKHPALLKNYELIYFSKSDFWDKMERDIKNFCEQRKLDYKIYFHHR